MKYEIKKYKKNGDSLNALPKVFGGHLLSCGMVFEQIIFTLGEDMIDGYSHGVWDVYTIDVPLESGILSVPVFAYEPNETYLVTNSDNYSSENVRGFIAGVALSLIALSRLSFMVKSDAEKNLVSDLYHALRAFSYDEKQELVLSPNLTEDEVLFTLDDISSVYRLTD